MEPELKVTGLVVGGHARCWGVRRVAGRGNRCGVETQGAPERLDQLRSLGKEVDSTALPQLCSYTSSLSLWRVFSAHQRHILALDAGAMGSSSEPAVPWSFLTAMNRRSRVQDTRWAGVLPRFSENKS